MPVESLQGIQMIALLFNWRIWVAVSLAVALAASHWKAYKSGGASAREELNEYRGEMAVKAAEASEAARKKEAAYQSNLAKVTANYAKVKADNAAMSVTLDDSLRHLKASIDDRSSPPAVAALGVNGTGGLERELLVKLFNGSYRAG